METEPAQCLNESISQEQKDHFRSDAGEETIRACYDTVRGIGSIDLAEARSAVFVLG